MHISASLIAHWETGRATPKLKDLEDCEQVLGTNGYLHRLLFEWVSLEVSPEWLEWLDVEEHAAELLVYETRMVHGLLQTPAYAETIPPPEKVMQRLARQQVFEKGTPPFFEALLDESVLYRKVGDHGIMIDQLNHLIDMAHRDLVIRIVPFSADLTRFTLSFALATVENGKQIASLSSPLRGQITERPNDIADLRRIWGQTGAAALSQQDSIDLIQETIKERWTG